MMRLASLVCLPLPNCCCCTSASSANRSGIRRSSARYALSTASSRSACVAAAAGPPPPVAVPVGEMDSVRKPLVDRAVIVGGGLGGLAAAIQLRKVGIDAQVYERNIRVTGGAVGEGTIIAVCPNGCRALSKADPEIVAKIKKAGLANMTLWVVNPETGEQVSTIRSNEHIEETYGQPVVQLLWQNLLNILSEALDDDCKHMGYECLDVVQDEEGATVQFKKGDEYISVKAPLVIGADGIHSVVRSKVFGPIPPRDHGRTIWRAVIDNHLCSDLPLKFGSMMTIENGRTMLVSNGIRGKLYWTLSLSDEITAGRTKVRSKDRAEAKATLRQEFEGWVVARKILEATDAEVILERRVLDLPVMPEWTRGRVVLLGDAAHAVPPRLGQGANLAFEDGFELARQLTSAPNLRCAFEAYEKRQMPRAQIVSENSQDLTSPIPQSFTDWLFSEEVPSSRASGQVLLV